MKTRSLKQTGYGSFNENLEIQTTELPCIKDNEILVKTSYASINPHDYKVVLGEFKKIERLKFPASTGSDFSGVVVRAGKGVQNTKVGDSVFGISHGALSEYCITTEAEICKIPTGVSFQNAASLPVAGMTTIQAFERVGGIKDGNRVLIHAGSGGVGSLAIQYAKAKGAYIYTTTGTNNVAWVRELGADRVIDYKKENYLSICSRLDIVLDTLGQQYTFDAFKAIKYGGKVVSLLPTEINRTTALELRMPALLTLFFSLKRSKIDVLRKKNNATYEFVFMRPNRTDLRQLAEMVRSNTIKPKIDRVFNFENAVEAFVYLSRGRARGKVLIQFQNF